MRKMLMALSAAVLLAAACTAGGGGSAAPTAVDTASGASHAPVTLTIWGQWTGREFKEFNKIFDFFSAKYPWITVNSIPAITDTKAIAGINSGTPPDVILSFGVDNVGKFCSTGAWIDLKPFIEGPDGIDMSQFPAAALTYTNFNGVQCSLPFMTDSFGLYYNTDMFKKAGITSPPKTTSELLADAKKLTVFNPDGSIKVAGLNPSFTSAYCCGLNSLALARMFDAQWYDTNGKAAFATDPNWTKGLQWQQQLTDIYGAGNLQTFVAGQGQEFSSANDFETGRVAMQIDGEWRNAFIKADAPNLAYSTAPLPVSDDHPELYGSSLAGGTVIGIPNGAPNLAEAWLLLKFMATDTQTLVYMTNTVNNVPTTKESLASPDLQITPQFKVFLDEFLNPNSGYKPATAIGIQDQTILNKLLHEWQAGTVTDLQAALAQAATDVDNAVAQAEQP